MNYDSIKGGLVKRYTDIINLLELIEPYYGETYRLTKQVYSNFGTKKTVLKYIKYLAGFSLISMQKEDGDDFQLDIDIIVAVFYASNLDNIKKFRESKDIEVINRIFKQDRINHCSKCCDYDE